MRKFRIVLMILLFVSCYLVVYMDFFTEVKADIEVIDPNFANFPEIDGYINNSANEWAGSVKRSEVLFPNGSQNGLDIDLWVMQNQTNLYFLVQFELEEHSNNEFLGLGISEEEEEADLSEEDYTDLKLIKFNLSQTENVTFVDLHLNNSRYSEDSSEEGYGAASIKDKNSIYEFCVFVDNIEAENNFEDVFLEKGKTYSFKVIFGEVILGGYKEDVKLSNEFFINVKFPPQEEDEFDWELTLNVLTIIIFSSLALFYAIYTINIIRMKKSLRRGK